MYRDSPTGVAPADQDTSVFSEQRHSKRSEPPLGPGPTYRLSSPPTCFWAGTSTPIPTRRDYHRRTRTR